MVESITTEEPYFPSINMASIFSHYIPMQSFVGLSLMSIPTLDRTMSSILFFEFDPTAVLLVNSMFGTTLYLSTKSHIKRLHKDKQIFFSVCGGVMFPFAVMYSWHLMSKVLPPDVPYLGSVTGLVTAAFYLKCCGEYCGFMDCITAACAVSFFGVPVAPVEDVQRK